VLRRKSGGASRVGVESHRVLCWSISQEYQNPEFKRKDEAEELLELV
jgi:hypothetical protein